MALIQTSLIWITYAIAIAILVLVSSVFVYLYQKPRDRAASVTSVCIFTVSALLATVLLLPVDVALVSSTVDSRNGLRKDWATAERLDSLLFTLKVVYYTLYSLDAVLCILVIPFTYFFYEEYDEVSAEEGRQSITSRLWSACKYTAAFFVFIIVLFLIGFFLPVSRYEKEQRKDLDFFKGILSQNHAERALAFSLGLLITLGTIIYVLYTGAGLALLPTTFIKSAPKLSAPDLANNTQSELEQNLERQRQLEARNEGREGGLDSRDRRELESLVRDERTLRRRERLATEASGEGQQILMRAWQKISAVFRPLKLIGGLFLMLIALVICISMLITTIDKAKSSGSLIGNPHIIQPIDLIMVNAAKVFPIDYVLFVLLVMFLFSASVVGIAYIGIRFLWITLFKIRKGQTAPQAMLMATVMLTLMVLAINYAIVMIIAPQYSTFGPQTYCDIQLKGSDVPVSEFRERCSNHHDLVKPCSELIGTKLNSQLVCTPSVVSSFINQIVLHFPFFGVITFWAQFVFLGFFFITATTMLFRTPKLDEAVMDEDLEEEEEEGLLGSTGRRFQATWHDITGRARENNPAARRNYGATD